MRKVYVRVGSVEQELLKTYCLGKSKIWNLFFGWEKTIYKGINADWIVCKINYKHYKTIREKADYLTGECYNAIVKKHSSLFDIAIKE